jgi:hypothetical protein
MDSRKWKIAADKIRNSENYHTDKNFILASIEPYKKVPRGKTYELHDFFTNHANKLNWSSVRLDTLLHDIIVLHMKNDPEYSEDIYDLLTNYLDALEGWCSPQSHIILKNNYWFDED